MQLARRCVSASIRVKFDQTVGDNIIYWTQFTVRRKVCKTARVKVSNFVGKNDFMF